MPAACDAPVQSVAFVYTVKLTVPVGVVNAPDTVALSCTVEPIAADKIAAAPAASFAPAPAWMSVTVDDDNLLGVNGSHKPSDAR